MYKTSFLLSIFMLLFVALASAAETGAEMADVMRANGKIYVVVLVIATIFAGIILYLVRLDRKISNIEKNK